MPEPWGWFCNETSLFEISGWEAWGPLVNLVLPQKLGSGSDSGSSPGLPPVTLVYPVPLLLAHRPFHPTWHNLEIDLRSNPEPDLSSPLDVTVQEIPRNNDFWKLFSSSINLNKENKTFYLVILLYSMLIQFDVVGMS